MKKSRVPNKKASTSTLKSPNREPAEAKASTISSSEHIRTGLALSAPLGFLFFSIFVFRFNLAAFYILSGLLLVSIGVFLKGITLSTIQKVGFSIVALSAIGLSSSVMLTLEKIEILKDPTHVTSCSISPIVSCSPVIGSAQATAFGGVPNPIFGLFGYTCFLAAGMGLLAGAKYNRLYWLTMWAGTIAGSLFSIWLMHEALYDIGALCLYCMAVWLVSFSLFWISLAHIVRNNYLSLPPKIAAYIGANEYALSWYSAAVVVLLVFFRWSDYWTSLF